jgi:hypothetical protein
MAQYRDLDPGSSSYSEPIAALIVRVILYQQTDDRLEISGFFYIDAP